MNRNEVFALFKTWADKNMGGTITMPAAFAMWKHGVVSHHDPQLFNTFWHERRTTGEFRGCSESDALNAWNEGARQGRLASGADDTPQFVPIMETMATELAPEKHGEYRAEKPKKTRKSKEQNATT